MSESEGFQRDDAPSPWRRWQMGELKAPPRQASSEPESPQQAQQAAERREARRREAELEALRERVRREAHEAGLAAGREQGHAEGLAQGLEEGRRRAQEELDARLAETLSPLAELAGAFGEALETLDEAVAEDLVDLALATGHQLAGEALKSRPRQVLELVRALLHTEPPLVGQQRLWLHPLDHKLVQTHLGDDLSAAGWTLQPDDQLSRGGCRVTSANGELDATWESRWQAVKAQVRHRRPAAKTSEEPQL
ncbi:Flagellar assembly protein FliH [Halomonas sp. THAF5a]|uniref:flagellar assembly protein FliH n=1 Tax=Halomonas sp. THAF5a TaxID=2587844 RepID=UPI001269055E|nr:flagellar assembly protein FliH [Halomonas sp. THAF5a]QFU00132.1 Flagellar assembly protein FliH [Halomonas sp. THAF5a]